MYLTRHSSLSTTVVAFLVFSHLRQDVVQNLVIFVLPKFQSSFGKMAATSV